MFKKLIWGTDGSEFADRAIGIVESLGTENGATVVAVHCVEYLMGPGARGAFPQAADEDERQAKVAKQVADLQAQGVNITLKVVQTGLPGAAHAIAEVAQEEEADLIVVGTRGHTALAGLLLGSVTQRLLHIARCPVLAVPAS